MTPNKSAQAYDVLERMVIFQELPAGAMVSEAELMDKSGFGRTPLREALQRLSRDNLVQVVPRRGILVPPISVESQLKLLETRRPLEEMAATLAASRARPEQRSAALQRAKEFESFTGRDLHEFERVLRAGHELVAESAQNQFLENAMAPLQGLSRRYWFAHLRTDPDDVAIAIDRHSELLTAIGEQDRERAAAAARSLIDYLTEFAYASVSAPL
ncbi:GntR family transcriptional regulator [Rhodococcus sp. 14C212]|uniref:GntR family transcriptional regulator n=1 Tax=Rhodococcus sp. 14C212 TaxID=2711209 RepID=UPI0013ED715A|nr:GntR family transcriptional regulator [Rhodococcus sp. 14C212]NGP05765.1 GntR family transcriptional regulator [Rhodococcus sp. 14C212]